MSPQLFWTIAGLVLTIVSKTIAGGKFGGGGVVLVLPALAAAQAAVVLFASSTRRAGGPFHQPMWGAPMTFGIANRLSVNEVC